MEIKQWKNLEELFDDDQQPNYQTGGDSGL